MTRHLGIDVGGSATRWHLSDRESGAQASGATQGFSGHLYRADVRARAEAAIAAVRQEAGPADGIVAGVTGLSRGTPESAQVEDLLRQAFGAARIAVMNDIELACRATFEPGEGIVVYAGTGSIAAHVTAEGQLITAGGKGVLIDDAGGGYWIAITALRLVLRAEDARPGSGWRTPLGAALEARLGGSAWPTVRQKIYGGDRGEIGMLARGVAEAAYLGDKDALGILAQAGRELAGFATMLESRVGPRRIAIAGRAAGLHDVILDQIRETMARPDIWRSDADMAEKGAWLAASPSYFAGLIQHTGD